MSENLFSTLSDDIILKIFFTLEDDPRNWARLSCVSLKFSSLIHTICYKTKCIQTIPSLVTDLLSGSPDPPGGWAALYKLAVSCPGPLLAGICLENADFGLERELGPDENYKDANLFQLSTTPSAASSSSALTTTYPNDSLSECSWSLCDDLYLDTLFNASETLADDVNMVCSSNTTIESEITEEPSSTTGGGCEFSVCKNSKVCCRSLRSHLASGVWNLSIEQGTKLLASRFRGDSLYICDWPGCVHIEEKRNYMLFRGIFKNFKRSRVWRTIKDVGDRSKIDLNCAFCSCKQVWDLHSAFCLKRVFGYHDDGEPVVRAYVCDDGHVSGAWTDCPLYA